MSTELEYHDMRSLVITNTIRRLLINRPQALEEFENLPDVQDVHYDLAYGVTPALFVRYDRSDLKTERVRLDSSDELFEAYIKLAWNSPDITPDFDGDYLVKLNITQECGAVHLRHKVVNCHMNKWALEENEELVQWMNLPE